MNRPDRRQLLKLAAALPGGLPVFGLAAGGEADGFSYYLVKNQVTGTGVRAGALVLVDAGVGRFAGDGYYLFPDWGTPAVYEVKARGNALVFYYPGGGRPLWTISAAHADARFGGRIEGMLDDNMPQDMLTAASLRVLEVPERPVA